MIKKLTIILGILFCTSLVNAQVINLEYNIEQVTVQLDLYQPDGKVYGCTGVVISNTPESSKVLTAGHCVAHERTILIGGLLSKNYKKSKKDDLAIIYFNESIPNKLSVKLAWENNKVGDKVYHMGYPSDTKYYTSGKITNILFNTWADFKVFPGCSGGGVFNESGELVGITVARFLHNDEAILEPIKSIRNFLNNLE